MMRLRDLTILTYALAAFAVPVAAQSGDDGEMTQAQFDEEARRFQADLEDLKRRINAAPPEAFDAAAMKAKLPDLEKEARKAQADLDQMTAQLSRDPYSMFPDVTLPSGEVVSAKRYLNQILQGIPAEGKLILPAPMKTSGGKTPLTLQPYADVLGSTPILAPQVTLESSEIIFGGTGSDRGGSSAIDNMDLHGKTVILLQDYRAVHRWKVAVERGAAAVLLIVSTERQPMQWDVARSAWGMAHQGMSQDPALSDPSAPTKIIAVLSNEGARKIFANAGVDFDASMAAAQEAGFEPFTLNMTASMTLEQRDAKDINPDTWK
jgi:hypothetical protein